MAVIKAFNVPIMANLKMRVVSFTLVAVNKDSYRLEVTPILGSA